MTAREMQIEIKQSLQQVSAYRTRKYTPEEIDWVLNKIYDRFVQSKVVPRPDGSGGFEVNQLDADCIAPLIAHAEMDAYIESEEKYYCILPADYQYLLSDWSYATKVCGTDIPGTFTTNLNLYALKLARTAKSAAPFYATLTINLGNSLAIPSGLTLENQWVGYQDKMDISFLRPYLMVKGKYYWEQYGKIKSPGYFLSPSTGTLTPTLLLDGSDATTTTVTALTFTKHAAGGVLRDNRLTASSKIAGLQQTAFYESSWYSPISELGDGILNIYRNSSFTVSRVGISYIRKYAPISVSLGSNCELPEKFHQTICDLAVEYLKGRLDDAQGVQLTKEDINKRVTF